jgi:hypothetical protein
MSKSKMVGPPYNTKDVSCLGVIGRFPLTYIYQKNRPPNSSPPPLIQLKSKMPKQNQTSTKKSETITISEFEVSSDQQPILEAQTQNRIPCFSSQLTIEGKVRLRRILPKTSTRKETIPSDPKPAKKKTRQGKLILPTSAAYAEILPTSISTMEDKLATPVQYSSSKQSRHSATLHTSV